MESIIPALLESEQTDHVKRYTLRQLLSTPSAQNLTPEACHRLLSLSLEWSINETSALHRHFGDATLVKWGRLYPTALEEVFLELGPRLAPTDLHSPWSIQLFHTALSILREGQSSCVSVGCATIRCALETALKGCNAPPSLDIMAALARLVCAHEDCLPRNVPTGQIVKTAVSVLARATLPKKDRPKVVLPFQLNCGAVAQLIASVWRTDPGSLLVSLKQVFLALTDISCTPSPGLSCILSRVPVSEVGSAVEWATSVSGVSDVQLRLALCRLIEWLEWSADSLHHWIMEMMTSLASTKRVATLLSVAIDKVTWVFSLLASDVCRAEALPVVRHILLGIQHAPVCFNKILPLIPDVIASVKASNLPTAREHLLSLAEVLSCAMHKFPQSGDVYQPVLEALEGMPKPSKAEMEQILQQSRWLNRAAKKSSSAESTSAPKRSQPVFDLSFLPPPLAPGRSETGKAGLVNLGNTCYINCVLQALFMSDSFSADVLQPQFAFPTSSKPSVFLLLQRVFAFLVATERQAYTPREFVQAARPQHFAAGTQQDCAEFFRLLLDRLHEEEKATRQRQTTQQPQSEGASSADVSIGPVREEQRGLMATSADMQVPSDQGSNEEQTLSKCHFTVGLTTTYACHSCQTQSKVKEDSFDVMLAFPEGTPGSGRILGGERNVTVSREDGGGLRGPLPLDVVKPLAETPEFSSTHQSSTVVAPSMHSDEPLALEQMLKQFLLAEQLVEDNQYMCEKCTSRQDGERTTCITKAPQLLLITLMRFKYNRVTHQKTKILTQVVYPEHLRLPVECHCQNKQMEVDCTECVAEKAQHESVMGSSSFECTESSQTDDSDAMDVTHATSLSSDISAANGQKTQKPDSSCTECSVDYRLSAVVVHAGSGTEAGHYYTYARHALVSCTEDSKQDSSQWYQFNDSSVTQASQETVLDVRRGLSSNTAYMLLYTRADVPQQTATLPPELLAMVAQDNSKFQQEKSAARSTSLSWKPPNKSSGNGGSGAGGGGSGLSFGSCGGNSLTSTTNRVVF